MERKGILYLFTVPVSLFFYALWLCWRVGDAPISDNVEMFRWALAWSAILLTGGALLVVGTAICVCTTSARASHHSQTILINKFTLCRRLLPVLMVGEIVACGLATICLVLSEVIWTLSHIGGAGGFKLVVILLLAVGVIFWMLIKSLASIKRCFAIFKQEDTDSYGINITEACNPMLWRWVRDLTERGRLTVPDNIVVGFFECFYVTANAVNTVDGERLTGNTLYLPLTYMALLDENEVAAVIGHELGHFTGEDTQYSLRFAPLYAGIENSLEHMANSSQGFSWLDRIVLRPSLDMGVWFLQSFHETVSYWSRVREHAADSMGAEVSSPMAMASALLRMSVLDEPVSRFLDDMIRKQIVSDCWLASLVTALQSVNPFELHNAIDSEIAHPMDSHPTTRARIALLAVELDDQLQTRAVRPVTASDGDFIRKLFSDVDALCSSLTQKLLGHIVPQREAYRQALETEAVLATESVARWTRTKEPWYMIVLGFLMLLGGGYLVLFCTVSAWFWMLPFAGTASGILGVITLRRTRQPLLVFTSDSITSSWLPQPLPLKYVSNGELTIVSSSLTIKLFLNEEYQPNVTTKRFMQAIRFNPRQHAIIIVVSGSLLRQQEMKKVKLDAQALMTLIGQYIGSAHARAELADF